MPQYVTVRRGGCQWLPPASTHLPLRSRDYSPRDRSRGPARPRGLSYSSEISFPLRHEPPPRLRIARLALCLREDFTHPKLYHPPDEIDGQRLVERELH